MLLDSAISSRIDNDGTVIEKGLIDKALEQLTPFISKESDTVDENLRRPKKWFYQWDALREVFANALAHRDWTRFVEIDVVVYSDRLEVISPSILPNSMMIEKNESRATFSTKYNHYVCNERLSVYRCSWNEGKN